MPPTLSAPDRRVPSTATTPKRLSSRPSPRSLLGATVLAAGVALAGLGAAPGPASAAAPPASGDDPASRFTLAVLPDTQFYSRYAESVFEQPTRYGDGNNPYAVQTEWLAANADELRIPFVAHLGDVVDRVGVEGEWVTADAAMRTLDDAGVPYSILAGNHDVRDESNDLYDDEYDLADEPFLRWFGPTRAAQQSTYGGSDPTGMNQYHLFEAEGQRFMVLALSWRASDATLAWADAVMAQHPDVPVILTSHDILDIAADGTTPRETPNGLRLWDRLIRGNDQIFLTVNGHYHGASRLVKANDAGHPVHQVVMDYQMAYEGGNGYLGLFEFDLTNERISVQTGSPWVVSKPADRLTRFDQPFLEGENQQFMLDVDFTERFAGFAPGFTAGTPDEPSLTRRARDLLLEGFVAPEPVETALPTSTDDYPVVDGTLAHWRMNGREGTVAEGASIPDVAGGNDLTRASIAATGSPTAAVEDVYVTGDADPFSSDGAALCFANSSRLTDRFSYLTTAEGAPVNDAQLADGYTIETFLRMDASWTADANAWMKAFVRSGNRSRIGVPQSRWDWTASPVALGLSNLREFQWTEVPIDTSKGDRTNWSGEIILDRWVHVAIVNDPATATTTMYAEGAPVLRTASDTVGHGIDRGMPWLFGSDWVDDRGTNGWAGCIGETRVVDHPIGPDEWLTARADEPAPTLASPTLLTPWDGATLRRVRYVAGFGIPGATVTVSGAATGTATVLRDGHWWVRLDAPLPSGEHRITVRQASGGASSAGVAVAFTVR